MGGKRSHSFFIKKKTTHHETAKPGKKLHEGHTNICSARESKQPIAQPLDQPCPYHVPYL